MNIKLEKTKLDKAYINYCKLVDKNLPYKFAYLDEWLFKSSKLLINETEKDDDGTYRIRENQKYRTYDRGTLIKVDFGVNLGSEMSQIHFAIVLNNYDNPKNNVLTVIPLTSKQSKFNINLGTLIIDKLTDKIHQETTKLGHDEEFQKLKTNSNTEIKLKKLRSLLCYYKSSIKSTYACPSLITTISKTRIIKPINEFDIIGKEKCSSEIMNKIDESIINNFTKKV